MIKESEFEIRKVKDEKITNLISDYFEIPEIWAKVYYQLLKSGSGTIGKVLTKELDINRQQIYNILDKLVAIDLVIVISQSKRGNIYLANTIETTVKSYTHKLETQLVKKIDRKAQFINDVNYMLHLEDSPSLMDRSFQGNVIPKDRLGEALKESIEETIRTFKVAIKDFSMGIMPIVQPAIKKALDRDTTIIQLLFDQSQANVVRPQLHDNSWFKSSEIQELIKNGRLQIRFTNKLTQNFFLFDDVIFLLVFSGIEEDIDFSFVTKVDQITRRFKEKFEKLFENAVNFP